MAKTTKNDKSTVNCNLIRRQIQRCIALFLLPTFGAFAIGFIYPFLKGVYLSFCSFITTSDATWNGVGNYVNAFRDASLSMHFGIPHCMPLYHWF